MQGLSLELDVNEAETWYERLQRKGWRVALTLATSQWWHHANGGELLVSTITQPVQFVGLGQKPNYVRVRV